MNPVHGLYAILETSDHPQIDPVRLATAWLEGGIKLIQLRQKKIPRNEKLKQAVALLKLKKNHPFTFIINDDPGLCLESGADGLHIGQEDISPAQARRLIGPEKILGLSTHSLDEALRAQAEPVDYIGFGGIYPTTTKPAGHPVLGLKNLKICVNLSQKPVVAIGGINETNIKDVFETGVASAAIVSGLRDVGDPRAAVLALTRMVRDY